MSIHIARDPLGNGGWCLFVGPLRVRWQGRNFRPLFSERYGYRRWLKIGRLGFRWDRGAA